MDCLAWSVASARSAVVHTTAVVIVRRMHLRHRSSLVILPAVVAGLLATGCRGESAAPSRSTTPSSATGEPAATTSVASTATVAVRTPKQVTGVAVSKTGRIFVNFPRWVDEPTPSVAEVAADGSLVPYPDAAWNGWQQDAAEVGKRFVCVQSVFVDDTDTLWILDPAAPGFQGPLRGGAKLLRVNLGTDTVERVYAFDEQAAPPGSYLNDVRIAHGHAFMTDSGQGAIVVLDLATGTARRLLDRFPATQAETGVDVTIGGKPWLADGQTPRIHSDGIAIDPKREYLSFQALTGRTLHRVPIAALLDHGLSPAALGAKVERVATTQPSDGIEFDSDGNLYMTALEESAITVLRADGTRAVVAHSPEYEWPDSIAITPGGELYFTTSQIQHMPAFNGGTDLRQPPYRVYRISTIRARAAPAK